MDVWSGVAGVVIGWALAQFSTTIAGWFARKKIKRALLDELRELHEALDQTWIQWARSLQMIAAGRIDNAVPLPLAHFIFTNHYKDAALGMNTDQRRSMQMIHSYVDKLNEATQSYRTFLETIHDPGNDPVELTAALDSSIKDKLRNFLNSVRTTQWHIRYHFDHPLLPDLNAGTPAHKQYARYREKVRDEIAEIEKQGTTVDPKRFDEIYIPEHFDNIADE